MVGIRYKREEMVVDSQLGIYNPGGINTSGDPD
jgi:hypothetical protein